MNVILMITISFVTCIIAFLMGFNAGRSTQSGLIDRATKATDEAIKLSCVSQYRLNLYDNLLHHTDANIRNATLNVLSPSLLLEIIRSNDEIEAFERLPQRYQDALIWDLETKRVFGLVSRHWKTYKEYNPIQAAKIEQFYAENVIR